MKNKPNFVSELSTFTGTTGYHKITLVDVIATDGIAHAITKFDLHWLFSDMAIAWFMKVRKKHPQHADFLVWNIRMMKNGGAVVTAHWDCEEDGSFSDSKKVYEQKYVATDFKEKTGEDNFSWYSQGNVFLLKSEN